MNAVTNFSPSNDTIFLMVTFNDQTGKWGIDSSSTTLKSVIPEQNTPEELQKLVEAQFPQSSVMFHKPLDFMPE